MADLEVYFRAEAADLIEQLTRGLLDLEKDGSRVDVVGHCFRLAHTLKGAARVVGRMQVGELAHAMEDALAAYRDGSLPIDRQSVSDLLRLLEIIRLEALGEAAPSPVAAAPGAEAEHEEAFETVRVAIAQMDELLDGLSEVAVQLGALQGRAQQVGQMERLAASLIERVGAAGGAGLSGPAELRPLLVELHRTSGQVQRELDASLARMARELGGAQSRASTLRLMPVSAIFTPLELAVRDAAQALGKRVEFETEGGDARLEGHVLAAVHDALLHVVRNAVAHGIEAEEVRRAAGKPPVGRVRLRIEGRGRRIAFLVTDDGGGVDLAAVRQAAVARQVIGAAEAAALGDEAALELVFRGGVSTSDTVTGVSGRGVGLDVVRETVARLKGEAHMHTTRGQGATVTMVVPVSLSAIPVLLMVQGGASVLMPLDAVHATRRVGGDEIGQGADGAFLLHEGEVVPFVPLSALLGGAVAERAQPEHHGWMPTLAGPQQADNRGVSAQARWSVVIVQAGARRVGVGVERLLGTMDVVVKPLPPTARTSGLVAGAAFDAQGDPLLVLDPRGIGDGARVAAGTRMERPAPRRRLPILVIDDSLTTRMLERSILESLGYEVDLAASAEEGLERARQRRYGLFIVDVQMPGMDGFTFTEVTRADAELGAVPVMLVTSQSSPADRHRGMAAGASAYIVKGEFDQRQFVGRVAELLGG
ncbi:MAG TPA: response regulator [Polyangia bacterium]|nr:response regulator [Polyangia bacterium]